MSREAFEESITKMGHEIIGEFRNEYGEQWVLYRLPGSEAVYMSGDDIDWKEGYRFTGTGLAKEMVLNAAEISETFKVIARAGGS